MRAENLTPTKVRSLDRPAHTEFLYQLSYPRYLMHSANYQALHSALLTTIFLFLNLEGKIRWNIIKYINYKTRQVLTVKTIIQQMHKYIIHRYN